MSIIIERIETQIEYLTDCLRRATPEHENAYFAARAAYKQAKELIERADKLSVEANDAMALYMMATGGPAEPFGG